MISAQSALGFAAALLLAQALAWSLARGLSLRLPWKIQALGVSLPLAILLPLLHGHRLIVPVDAPILANIPDAPRVASPDDAHGVFNDAVLQLLPWEAEVRRGFAEGHLPLWSDLLDGGSSPWVNPQAAVLSPIAMLGRLLPIEHFLLGALAVKILLAFEGCWLLARLLGAGRAGAALAALGFALGGPVMAWAVFPLSSVVAWSPWLALAAMRVIRQPCARFTAMAALIFAALLLSGHPEIAVAEGLVAAGFGVMAWRRGKKALPRLAAGALAVVLGSSLSACGILPFLLVAPHSLRASRVESAPAPSGPGALPGFPPGEGRLFLATLSPWAFGRPFHEPFAGPGNWPIAAGGYLGLVALTGCAAALASGRRRLVLALLALALFLFFLAAGFYPFQWVLRVLPLGRALAFDRFLPAAALPLAALAALGLDEILRRKRPAAMAMALLAATASLCVRHDAALVAVWLVIVSALFLTRSRRSFGAALLALAAFFELGMWDRDVLPRGHRELFYPRTPLIAAIESAMTEGGPWRALAGGFGIYPSLLPMYGVADVRIDNPIVLQETLRPLSEVFEFRPEGYRYKSAFRHLEHPFLDFLNVRVIALAGSAPVPPRFELLRGDLPLRVFRNPSALPRFFLPVAAEMRGRADALSAIRGMRDARRVVLIREETAGWRPAERVWAPAAVGVVRARRGFVSLTLPPDGEKLLATSLPFPAGWNATAGERALRRVVVNTAYFGAVVPPGIRRVDLSFAPPGFRLGAALSVLGAGALFLLAAAPRARAAIRSCRAATQGEA